MHLNLSADEVLKTTRSVRKAGTAAHAPAHEEKLDAVEAQVGMLLDDEVLDLKQGVQKM
jgi:hypothetical protein